MDNISSIMPLEDTHISQETSQFSSYPLGHQELQIIPQDYHHSYHQVLSKLLQDHDLKMVADKTHEMMRFKRSKSSSCIDFRSSKDDENSSGNHHQSCKKKKIIHRDVERQRRQDMASLYSSLRSLLPLEYLKGKRSISDHIHEAVNYIKHMEEKIRNMSDKRNKLKRFSSGSDSSMETLEGSRADSLRVEACFVGVQVVIKTSMRQKGFPLSKVVAVLTQEGLNVVSCISTKVNQSMLYSIKSEVNEGRNIDLCEMQEKLNSSIIKRFGD